MAIRVCYLYVKKWLPNIGFTSRISIGFEGVLQILPYFCGIDPRHYFNSKQNPF
jgi:hypothetical protein